MDTRVSQLINGFTAIGLDELNAKAAMLERRDNKYIVEAERLLPALEAFGSAFDVLEIGGKRAFTYDTRYFDCNALRGYYDHHQGRRKRCKVRIRDYVDAGMSYLEVKLKDKRGSTVKKRLKLQAGQAALTPEGLRFIDEMHSALYEAPFARPLSEVIAMRYRRITLVAREGGERMTIDTDLAFDADGRSGLAHPGVFIVETKSRWGRGIADRIMRANGMHPTKSVSKYCVGLAGLGLVERRNRFLPALRRLRLDATDAATLRQAA